MEEDYLPSESEEESDGEFYLYGEDPIFKTKEDLDNFMKSCDVKMVKKTGIEDEFVFLQEEGVVKHCTCGSWEDIWSGNIQHLCCQQVQK